MAHVKKGNRCSPKETNLRQIPGKDEPQRMFLKRDHIRPQAPAGDVQSVKEHSRVGMSVETPCYGDDGLHVEED